MSLFEDARSLPDRTQVETDLAIIGAGPAGITVARGFANARIRVCLIEAGGLTRDAASQTLYEGENAGIEYPLALNRLRFFGGSSNHWGGYCLPLDPIDFETRQWVPYSGWPFGREELDPYYGPACDLVEVGSPRFDDPRYWREQTGQPLLPAGTGRMRTRFVQFSPPTHFGERYRADLEQAPNIRVLLNANVVNIAAAPSAATVTHLDVATLDGRRHTVKARRFVLAVGGLENARLLLLSDGVVNTGLGNQNDLVGRFFMEHPHLTGFGEVVMADLERLPRLYRERLVVEGRPAQAAFAPSVKFLRERRLLSANLMLGLAGFYRPGVPTYLSAAKTESHRDMLRAARPFLIDTTRSSEGQDWTEDGAWLGIGCACEQVPDPDSRVGLSAERDALGLRKIRLDWRLGEQSRRSVLEHMRSLALEMGALGIGRMTIDVPDDGRWPKAVTGGCHHMGTARMSDDPKRGVVDRHCRVHGVDNLYVAGSSVFPTSGAANPTLTLVALALRLVDHLRGLRP